MGIDWFTFAAQVVNFLILIGLLWYFAYKPILRAMDEREKSIRDRLDDAEHTREESDRRARELDEKHAEFDEQREQKMAHAREEAEKRRKELVAAARERVEQSESEWRESLRRQKDSLIQDLERRTGHHVVEATRRILQDMADAELEARVVDVFAQRLRDVDSNTRQNLQEAVSNADGQVRLVSAFSLDDTQRETLRERVGEITENDVAPTFETDDTLLCGIELQADDRRIAWNVDDYLDQLREQIDTTIASAGQAHTETAGTDNNTDNHTAREADE